MRLRIAAAFGIFTLGLCATFGVSQNLSAAAQNAGSLEATLGSTAAIKSYHDHSIRDIDAVGNRNVGCGRGFGNWYSLERQIAMGKFYSDRVEATSKIVRDPEVTDYVNRIGQNLVRNSDSLVPFTIKVIESDDVNAFALPGGYFYIDSGLIVAADSEAELAGVMAHEIAHVAACHAARSRTRAQLMNLATFPVMMTGGPLGYAAYQTLSIIKPLTALKFSRKFESEADYLGIQYLYKAGYDPQALTAFFEKVKMMEKGSRSAVGKAFETHPQTPDRIEKTQDEIATLLPPQGQYKVDSSDFEDVKARLNYLDNRLRLTNGHGGHPALRRRVSPDIDEPKPDDGDGPPELARGGQ
jgi:beta-barrel assembly-enhancing protease